MQTAQIRSPKQLADGAGHTFLSAPALPVPRLPYVDASRGAVPPCWRALSSQRSATGRTTLGGLGLSRPRPVAGCRTRMAELERRASRRPELLRCRRGDRVRHVGDGIGRWAGRRGCVRAADPRSGRSERLAREHCAVGSLAIFAHVAFPRCCDGLPHGEPDVAGLAEGQALRALDLVPATSGAGFFPPPATPEGTPAGFASRGKKTVSGRPPLRSGPLGAGRSPPASRPPSGRDGRGLETRE